MLKTLRILLACLPATLAKQMSAPPPPVSGALIVAHGGDSAWNARVLDVAREARTGGPVEVAFLMGPAAATHRFQDAAARLERAGASRIVVVPMLVSSHSGHFDQVRYLAGEAVTLDSAMLHHLHMSGTEPARATVPIVVAPGMDASPEIARVLASRASALARGERLPVFLIAHGPNSPDDEAAWMANLRVLADSVKATGEFADVRVGVLRDDAPAAVRAEAVTRCREIIALQAKAFGAGTDVVVVPLLVSAGAINSAKIPRDFAGLPIRYSGEPLLPHAEMSQWVARMVSSAAARGAPSAGSR